MSGSCWRRSAWTLAAAVEAYPNGPYRGVALDNEDAVGSLSPDLGRSRTREVAVNCFAGSGRRWKTRMFAAGAGVLEDPRDRLGGGPAGDPPGEARTDLLRRADRDPPGSGIGRPSMLYARGGSPERIERVEVGGSAVLVARGAFAERARAGLIDVRFGGPSAACEGASGARGTRRAGVAAAAPG